MLDRIELRGLRAVGRHGVLSEERQRPQPFEVDLDLYADLEAAGRTDELGDTVDYGAVSEAVAAVIAGEHVDLLETLATRIARVAFKVGGMSLEQVTVTVRKLRPPVPVDLGCTAVTITRRHDHVG